MATNSRIKRGVVTKTPGDETQLIVQELNIMSADRSSKTAGDLNSALRAAEMVHFPNLVRIFDIYDRAMLDGHLTGITNKRDDAVLNKTLYYQDKSGKRVDAYDALIELESFRDLRKKILETPRWGRSGIEFIPGAEFAWEEIPRKHINMKERVISYEQGGETGIPYEGVSNLWILGKKNDLGLLLKCSLYAIYKSGNYGDWAQYVEIFGQPVRVIKYDAFDEKTKMELRQVLDESGSSLALMIPKQADFEMKDGKQSNGDGQLQDRFKGALNEEMSIVILGNTETTSSSRSSGYAQSKEHGKQQLEITKSDLKYLLAKLNSTFFKNLLKSYGFPDVEGGKFVFEKEIDLESLKVRSEIDEKIGKIVPVSDDYYYDTYGISKPDNYDELKAQKDAERKAALNPGNPDPEGDDPEDEPKPDKKPAPKPPAKKAPKKNLKDLSAWDAIKGFMVDFFDPAL